MKKRYKSAIAAVVVVPSYFALQKLSNLPNFYFRPFWHDYPVVSRHLPYRSNAVIDELPSEVQRLQLIEPQRRYFMYFLSNENEVGYHCCIKDKDIDVKIIYSRQINLLGHERLVLNRIEFHPHNQRDLNNDKNCYTAGPGAIDDLEEILRSNNKD